MLFYFSVDLNLDVKVDGLGSYQDSHSQTSQVKWMPPEMLLDGINTEKTDVVGCT